FHPCRFQDGRASRRSLALAPLRLPCTYLVRSSFLRAALHRPVNPLGLHPLWLEPIPCRPGRGVVCASTHPDLYSCSSRPVGRTIVAHDDVGLVLDSPQDPPQTFAV